MSNEKQAEAVGLVILFFGIGGPIGAVAGFGIGALVFDSWLRSIGTGCVLAVVVPVVCLVFFLWREGIQDPHSKGPKS